MKIKLFYLLFIFLCYSCNDEKYIRKYSIPKTPTIKPPVVDNNSNNNKLEFYWVPKDDWKEGSSSSMRIGSYLIPYSKGEADLSITHFSGDGGGVQANVNRWRNQIDLPSQNLEEIMKDAVYLQTEIGPCKIFEIINNKKPETAFLCSIISLPSSTVFTKLGLSVDGIKELQNDFLDFNKTFEFAK